MNNMKKISALILAAGLALTVSGCSEKNVDSVKTIQEAGVLKAAIVNSDNGYTRIQGTELIGLEPDLAGAIAAALGADVEYQVMDRNAALQAVTDGTADIALGCINGSASIGQNFLCTTYYGKGFFYVVTKKGDYAQSLGSLEKSAVGVSKNMDDDHRSQLSMEEGIKVSEYGSTDVVAEDIKNGRIRAYVCGEAEAKELLSDMELQVQNMFDMDPEKYVIVAEKEDQALVSGMNTLIAQFLTKE